MDRGIAARILREEMDKHGLRDWSARLNPVSLDSRYQYMGLCSHKDKALILNAHHVDLHPETDVMNTIRHEIAHALVGAGHGHDSFWADKAKEIGCFHIAPCSYLGLPQDVIDAIRSGAEVEVIMEEEIIRKPKYQVTRLQDKCPVCNKVAVIKKESLFESNDPFKPDTKFIFLECGHAYTKDIPKGTPFQTIVFDGDESCAHEWNKTICIKCNAKKPYQFQLDGMKFTEAALATGKGVVIMDEMGLGKTIQAIGFLKFHPELWPVLFVVKSGLKPQWWAEIIRICGVHQFCQIINSSKDCLARGLPGYIIGYDMLVPKSRTNKNGKIVQSGFDIEKFKERGIKTVVMDECQQIKNPDSTRTQMVRRIIHDTDIKVIGLSGTPWKNRGSEFFTILNMVAPKLFSSYQGFRDRWVSTYFDGQYTKEGGIRRPEQFKEYIKDIGIRRQRTEVLAELPLINRVKLHIEMDQIQAQEYDDSVSDFVAWYNRAVIGGEEESLSGINILAKMSRMRHIAGLSKIAATEEYIEQFFEETERKLVVFAHHQDVQQILYDNAKAKYTEFPVLRISADMNAEQRFQAQNTFNESPRALMIASTLAAGEGLNLQTCADCVMHERQWNPANEEQAEGRFIRIGQTATSVTATYVEAADTIDALFDGIVERKRFQFHEAMNRGEAPQWNQSDIGKELAQAIVASFQKKNSGKKFVNVKAKVTI